jgi:sugar phosphate isomerase/epimerase
MTNCPQNYRLGINTGFAVNRFSEPEEWVRIIGDELGLRVVQLTADMLNVDLPASVVSRHISQINKLCQRYQVQITSTFTGAFTRVNHLAHPDPEIRAHWVKWFKKFADLSVEVGATSMGSHFGIFTDRDDKDLARRKVRRSENIAAWHEIAEYSRARGLKMLTWEPMSISREQGETLAETRRLQNDVNDGAPLPFRICLDVDHGNVMSGDPLDTDPYAWLNEFATESPHIHLKQSYANKGGHWPFTYDHNKNGRIVPKKVIDVLLENEVQEVDLLLELSFREREPIDSTVIDVLKQSVAYWRSVVSS